MTLALPSLENRLAQASTPEETRKLEVDMSAEVAKAKEEGDYETMVAAMYVWMLARRKTTSLITPFVRPGPKDGRTRATNLEQIGFSKSQYHRRMKELELTDAQVHDYFDAVLANGWEPSRNDMFRYFREASGHYKPDPCICPKCGKGH